MDKSVIFAVAGSGKTSLARALCGLAGVNDVVNNLQVKSTVSSQEVQRAIQAALERRAAREARDIKLDVHDDKVTLEGKVHSWAERELVMAPEPRRLIVAPAPLALRLIVRLVVSPALPP